MQMKRSVDEAAELLYRQGVSAKKIAVAFGVDVRTVLKTLRRRGVEIRPQTQSRIRVPTICPRCGKEGIAVVRGNRYVYIVHKEERPRSCYVGQLKRVRLVIQEKN
ncbi:MAG: hypothetical protein ACK4SY_06815 [Pyrobaculum sp.]